VDAHHYVVGIGGGLLDRLLESGHVLGAEPRRQRIAGTREEASFADPDMAGGRGAAGLRRVP